MTPTAVPAVSNVSTTPVGAIAGGVIGGVAAIILIILAIWYFARKSSRNDKDFDFAGDDAWDPAAVSSGVAAVGRGGSRNRRSMSGLSGGGGPQGHGGLGGGTYVGGAGTRYADDDYDGEYDHRNAASQLQSSQSGYYNDAGGMAGVGVAGLGRATSSGASRGDNNEMSEFHDGSGWGGAGSQSQSQLGHSNSQLSSQRQMSPRSDQSHGGQQQYNNAQYGAYPQPLQNPYDQSQHSYEPSQYLYDQSQQPGMAMPAGRQLDSGVASPTPTHRSIPALGAVWAQGGQSQEGTMHDEGEEEEDHRRGGGGGPLRVTNNEEVEEEEEVHRPLQQHQGQQAGHHEDEEEDAYGGVAGVMTKDE
jgi:hypothetical protein